MAWTGRRSSALRSSATGTTTPTSRSRWPATRRLYQIADVDSMWSPTYHRPGAAERLAAAADRWPIAGFTHYVSNDDDGSWLTSDEGRAFFRVAEERRLLTSIHCQTHHQPAIRRVAERFPSVPILIHHLGHVKASEPPPTWD